MRSFRGPATITSSACLVCALTHPGGLAAAGRLQVGITTLRRIALRRDRSARMDTEQTPEMRLGVERPIR